jgi:hypothetical protein
VDAGDDLPELAWRPVGLLLVAAAVLLTATSARYGYFRDELYFLAAGHHLAWSYPDQGPLVPFVWRVFDVLGHGSLVVERIPATVCSLGVTLAAAATARELGGRAFAQSLTATVVGLSAFVLGVGHIFVTATVDILVWTVVIWLTVHIIRTERDELWLVAGAVAGIGLLNKDLPEVLLAVIAAALAIVPGTRHHLRSKWIWLGGLVAALMWAPTLWWQATHGWPQITLAHEIHQEYSQAGNRIGFFAEQLLLFGLVGVWLWVWGAWRLWRDHTVYRVLPLIWLGSLVVFVITAGQGYYTAGTYPALIAAGAVALERRVRRRALVLSVAVVLALIALPPFLPLLSATQLANSPWSGSGENQFETVGWPELVHQVAATYDRLPAAQRAHTTILTTNYGEAGAIARFGPSHGLPTAYSGHNGFGDWGPPPQRDTSVVAVSEDGAPGLLRHCRRGAAIHNREGVSNEESQYAAIYVCEAPAQGWRAAWPRIRHLSS